MYWYIINYMWNVTVRMLGDDCSSTNPVHISYVYGHRWYGVLIPIYSRDIAVLTYCQYQRLI